jgi:hypothetical protein
MHRFSTQLARTRRGKTLSSTLPINGVSCRGYAVPVNKRTSLDPLLGVGPPPAPKAMPDEEVSKSSESNGISEFLASVASPRPNNPNDLSELLKGNSNKLSGLANSRSGTAQNNRSRTSAAIGAMRRGSGSLTPTQNLEDAFLPPEVPQPIVEKQQDVIPEEANSSSKNSMNATPVDREHPHPIDAILGRNDMDERILAAARALHHARTGKSASLSAHISTIPSLLKDFSTQSERTLSVELANESRPKDGRRVPVTSAMSSETELNEKMEDGVLLIAYVTGLEGSRGQERISVCSGFAVEGGDRLAEGEGKGKGALVVTCAHTVS